MAQEKSLKAPWSEKLKSIPGALGIRLDEEPSYELVEEDGGFEVRDYGRMTLASVSMKRSHDEFEDAAFRILAGFIFSHGLDMTIPVFKSRVGDEWTMSFVLPHGFRAKNAPAPEHAAIKIEERHAHRAAVYRYSGNVDEAKMEDAKHALGEWIQAHPAYVATGEYCWAQYDQPMAIPFMKRNEVLVEVKR